MLNSILGGLLGTLIVGFIVGRDGPRDLLSLSRHRARQMAENEALRTENAQLEKQIGKLRSDDAYVQRMIRTELGYTRPDEFVYHFHAPEHSDN